MKTLYAWSLNFIPQDGFGREVDGTPAIRQFEVTGESGQSLVVDHGRKVRKKDMVLELDGFSVSLYRSAESAATAMRRVLSR